VKAEWEQYQAAGEEALHEGDFAAAEIMWRAAYEQAKQFNKLDPRFSTTLEGLAESLWHQGKLDEAEPLCKQILDLFKITRGSEHPDVGVTANNLAMLYKSQGRTEDAEHLYKQALHILTKSLGPEHQDVLNLRVNYSEMLRRLGRATEADDLVSGSVSTGLARFTRSGQFEVLEVDPELHTNPIEMADHADKTWEQFGSSAERAFREGDYPGAETMWQAALKKANSFGETDPRLCVTLESLAEVLFKQTKYTEAEKHCVAVLKIYEKMLGNSHPDVGVVANNLAMLYHAQRNYQAAEQYYKQALPIRSKALGGEHPLVLNLIFNYTHLLTVTGRRAEAEKLKAYSAPSKGRWSRSGSYTAVSIPAAEQLHELN
jgi:tetratricopeptide (TPR) repeat protein